MLLVEVADLKLVVTHFISWNGVRVGEALEYPDLLFVFFGKGGYLVELICDALSELLIIVLGAYCADHRLQLCEALPYLPERRLYLRYLMPANITLHQGIRQRLEIVVAHSIIRCTTTLI